MNYIITNGYEYFCGWDMFGNFKFVSERRLAYRMKAAVADNTLSKIIDSNMTGYVIEKI